MASDNSNCWMRCGGTASANPRIPNLKLFDAHWVMKRQSAGSLQNRYLSLTRSEALKILTGLVGKGGGPGLLRLNQTLSWPSWKELVATSSRQGMTSGRRASSNLDRARLECSGFSGNSRRVLRLRLWALARLQITGTVSRVNFPGNFLIGDSAQFLAERSVLTPMFTRVALTWLATHVRSWLVDWAISIPHATRISFEQSLPVGARSSLKFHAHSALQSGDSWEGTA